MFCDVGFVPAFLLRQLLFQVKSKPNGGVHVCEQSRYKAHNECFVWGRKTPFFRGPRPQIIQIRSSVSRRVRSNCSILLRVESPTSIETATARHMTFPFSRSTCACESASVASQHQQAVFHRGVTEACEIRAESAQNNRAKPRDNPQPEHQRETVGHSSLPTSTKDPPPRKTERGRNDGPRKPGQGFPPEVTGIPATLG